MTYLLVDEIVDQIFEESLKLNKLLATNGEPLHVTYNLQKGCM